MTFVPQYNASVHAFAGPTFPDVNSLSSFLEFDKGFPLLAGELPAFMTKPTVKAREAAIDRIVEWVESVKAAGLDESKVGGAPRFLIEYAEEVGASTRDQACWVLMDVWALVANAPQAAIWALVRFSEHPQHLVRLREEIASGLKQAGGDIHTLLHSPAIFNSETFAFTTSAINETLRESSSVFSMRVVEEDTVLPENLDGCGGYLLKKGESVFCVTRSTHVDGDVYDDPNEWIPDRFMPGQRKGSKKVSNDYMPFGGGVSICEGELSLLAKTMSTSCTTSPSPVRVTQADTCALRSWSCSCRLYRTTLCHARTQNLPHRLLLLVRRHASLSREGKNRSFPWSRDGRHVAQGGV